MKYKAVIFDLDDTLLKTASIKWAHHKAVAKQFYDIDLTDEVLAKHWGKPFQEMIAIYYQNRDTLENMIQANTYLENQFLKELQNDAVETIHTLLSTGRKVGVVTSAMRERAKKDLVRFSFPIDSFFMLQGADDAPYHKPDPRVFSNSLSRLKQHDIAPHETLYVGDALMDYYAARDAQLGFIGVTTGLVTSAQFTAAGAASVSSLSEIFSKI